MLSQLFHANFSSSISDMNVLGAIFVEWYGQNWTEEVKEAQNVFLIFFLYILFDGSMQP